MAVMDFREGGYVFSRHKVRREFAYDSGEWEEAEPGYQGDPRYAADPAAGDGIATRIARLTHYLGALASVGLMVGLLAWGWQLVSRDVSGVPVIRAIEGEARSAPDNPGGELANYSGLTVNEVAAGAASAPVQELALAPSASELTGDDVAMGALGVEAREPSTESRSHRCPTARHWPWPRPRLPPPRNWPPPMTRSRRRRSAMPRRWKAR